MQRTTYRLLVRAEPGVDEIRALRAWLKQGLRLFGLKCIGITPKKDEEKVMDARKYASKYVKPDTVRDGPIQTRIISIFESERFNRPMLELETGSQFMLNETNNNTLIKAWGYETDAWIGKELVLELGTYKDWNEDPPVDKDTVKMRAVSSAKEAQNGSTPAKPLPPSRVVASPKASMDDEIPFALAFFIVSTAAWFAAGGSSLIA
jgi:hypothetical protein